MAISIAGSKLYRKQIPNVAEASRVLGTPETQTNANTLYNLVPVTMAPKLPDCRLFLQIPHGFHALMLSNGKDAGLLGPGLHIAPPWVTIAHLIPWQNVVFDAPVKQCPTQDNVMVSIDVSLVFEVLKDETHVRNFCYNLGPDKLDKFLRASDFVMLNDTVQEEAIRDMARKKKYSDIYDLMDTSIDEQLDNTKRSMNENLKEFGVEIKSITITNVHLPEEIAETMEKETTYESLSLKAARQQEYELLVLEDRERLHRRRQEVEEQVEELRQQGLKKAAAGSARLNDISAMTKKMIAEIKESETSEVNQVIAKSDFLVQEMHSSTQIALATIESDGKAQADQILAEAQAYANNLRATAKKTVAMNNVKALAARAEAEAQAGAQMKEKRAHDEKVANVKILAEMSMNQDITLAGNNGDNVLAQLLAGNTNATVIGLKE